MTSCCFLDVAGAKIDPDHPRRALAGAEVDLDVDLVAHHMLGQRLAVMLDADAAFRDGDAAIGDARFADVHVDARRPCRSHQPAPIGIAAVPAAFDQIVLDDVLGRDAGFLVARGAGDRQMRDARHPFRIARHLHRQVAAGGEQALANSS